MPWGGPEVASSLSPPPTPAGVLAAHAEESRGRPEEEVRPGAAGNRSHGDRERQRTRLGWAKGRRAEASALRAETPVEARWPGRSPSPGLHSGGLGPVSLFSGRQVPHRQGGAGSSSFRFSLGLLFFSSPPVLAKINLEGPRKGHLASVCRVPKRPETKACLVGRGRVTWHC